MEILLSKSISKNESFFIPSKSFISIIIIPNLLLIYFILSLFNIIIFSSLLLFIGGIFMIISFSKSFSSSMKLLVTITFMSLASHKGIIAKKPVAILPLLQ